MGGGVLIVAAAVVVIAVAALSRGSEAPTEAGPGVDDGAVTGAVATGTNTPGPKTALVTLEEFGDFQCSHCVDFASGDGQAGERGVRQHGPDTLRLPPLPLYRRGVLQGGGGHGVRRRPG